MKPILILWCLLLSFTSCQNNKNNSDKETNPVDNPIISSEENVDMHNSRNSLDWQGKYTGILPCVDCEGIETKLTLNPDGTYLLEEIYLGTQENELTTKGNFTWSGDGGSIRLKGIEEGASTYFVGENYLLLLQPDGTRPTGKRAENYKLIKE